MRMCKHEAMSDILQTVFQIKLLPFSTAFKGRYNEMDKHQNIFEFSSNILNLCKYNNVHVYWGESPRISSFW